MIPLIAMLAPLIPGLIRQVEGLFAGKPKSGVEKMATVADMLRALAQKLTTNGLVTGTADDVALRAAIESVFQTIKPTLATPAAAAVPQYFLVRGSMTALPAL